MNRKQFSIILVSSIITSIVSSFFIILFIIYPTKLQAQYNKSISAESFILVDKNGISLAELFIDKENEATLILRNKWNKSTLQLKQNALWMWNDKGELRVSLLVQPEGAQTHGEGTLFLIDNSGKVKSY